MQKQAGLICNPLRWQKKIQSKRERDFSKKPGLNTKG
jgi:hypothetical protein